MILLDTITQLPNGARFYKCDLHTHTPVDKSFHTAGYRVDTEEEKKMFARELVRYVRQECGLDVLGVTEHNDVSWIPYIQEAAGEVGLIVFPGVELGVLVGKRSIHFLALFNPKTNANTIDHWLSSLGLQPEKRFFPDSSPCGVNEYTTYQLTEKIEKASGISIAAHVVGSSGLLTDLEGEGRIKSYRDQHLLAVEIPESRDQLSKCERQIINGEMKLYGKKRVACLNHSDGRGLLPVGERLAIGSKATYIKMSAPSVEALRQAFLDWESRIRLESERRNESYPRVIGMAIEGGFLVGKEQPSNPFLLHFNPNLNCMIGGRGAGKSALIEALRYALAVQPKTQANENQRDDLLKKTLPPGAKITVFYETDDGISYRIERIWGKEPRVFDANSGEEKEGLRPSHLGTGANDPIEVYGQKEIYEISKDPEYQLRLLDATIKETLHPIQTQKQDILRRLETNAQSILRMTEEIEEAQEKIEQMPGIIEQLNRLEQQALKSTLDRKKQLDKEKSLLDRAGQAVEDLAHALEVFAQEQEYAISPDLMNESSRMNLLHPEFLVNQRRLLDKVEATFRQHMRDLPAQLRNLWNEGADERTNWKQQYDQEEEAYQQLLREHPDASIDTYINLQRKRQNLELIQQDVDKRKQRIAELRQERHQLLQNLQGFYQQEFDIRQQKIKELNRLLDGAVTIRIEREGNRDAYESYLREKLRGTNKRGIDRITSTVRVNGDYASPIDFVAAIRKEQELAPGQTSDLETVYHENENGRRILANLPETILFDIETFRIPDLPIIELQVNNRSKPLNELSVGQKCTAILSLILVERGSPLVIDQPEDDLDNRFIFEEIVQTLRREKERRQFIIATHNANIPVSGDAELIVVLDADEEHGWVECSGSIDEESIREPVENILEGGREAFRMRQAKYGAETWID